MSDGWGFAPPPFDPAAALITLKRDLRQLRGLTERGDSFELRGQPVLRLAAGSGAIDVQLAKRPAQNPEWTKAALKSGADVRRWLDTVKQQLGRWTRED